MKDALTCGFIGLGLIGGSIAKALRQSFQNCRLLAYDINKETLKAAVNDGVIDIPLTDIGREFSQCDYIFLCAPVSENDKNLALVKKNISPSCLLSDVGSVKGDIHKNIEKMGLSSQFIGGHPMAGSERVGYANSKALLLQNAYYILTPSESIPERAIEDFRELILSLGALPLLLTCKEHDYVTAAISHLPHVVAACLVNLIRDSDSPDGIMKSIAAGGFKDITRIASSSPVMWQQICLTNGGNISSLLDRYIAALQQAKEEIDRSGADALYQLFDSARLYRDSFTDASSGPIKKSYSIRVDIADEPGALAAVATLLALQQISIKNIGITHNRELAEGVLSVEFYDQASVQKAESILQAKGYAIHR